MVTSMLVTCHGGQAFHTLPCALATTPPTTTTTHTPLAHTSRTACFTACLQERDEGRLVLPTPGPAQPGPFSTRASPHLWRVAGPPLTYLGMPRATRLCVGATLSRCSHSARASAHATTTPTDLHFCGGLPLWVLGASGFPCHFLTLRWAHWEEVPFPPATLPPHGVSTLHFAVSHTLPPASQGGTGWAGCASSPACIYYTHGRTPLPYSPLTHLPCAVPHFTAPDTTWYDLGHI